MRIDAYWASLTDTDRERVTQEALAATALPLTARRPNARKDAKPSDAYLRMILDAHIPKPLEAEGKA